MSMYKRANNQSGYTIVELMIATSLLSVIILVGSMVMINIGRQYYKGINQAKVQNGARNITDEVATQLQLSSNTPIYKEGPDGSKRYCIGTTRYTFVLNRQISDSPSASQTRHVIWRDDNNVTGGCEDPVAGFLAAPEPSPSATGGVELMASNSRLSAFCIGTYNPAEADGCNEATDSPYSVTVGIVYGDQDLSTGTGIATRCNGGVDSQFCAVASMQTNVARRLVSD